jgi:hypothetical protein
MTVVLRVALALLALNELVVGAWNQFAPESFYGTFPTVDLTPPFSEHYARDFGGATLGIAVLLVIAFIRPRGAFVLPAGIAYTVFSIPHFVFHAVHLEEATSSEAAFLLLGNGLAAALGVLVILLAVLRMRRDRRAVHDPALG